MSGPGRDGTASPRSPFRIVLPLTLALVAGCGVTAESAPEPVPSNPLATTALAPPQAATVVQIYLVRDERLVAVSRTGRSVSDAMAALSAGPTALDAEAGLSSPLEVLEAGPVRVGGQDLDVVTVEVTPGLTDLSGPDQFLAVAQLVWTATGVCCATKVRVHLDGDPLPLPTDSGQVQRPVGRDDYRSVRPR